MATRFYFPYPSGSGSPTSPNRDYGPLFDLTVNYAGGVWNTLPEPHGPPQDSGRSGCSVIKTGGGDPLKAGTYSDQVESGGARPFYEPWQMFVSEPLPAFTFSGAGTVKGVFLCFNDSVIPGVSQMCGAVVIKVWDNAGTTVRSTLLRWHPIGIGGPSNTLGTDFPKTNPMTIIIPPNLTVPAATMYNGDRITFELGVSYITRQTDQDRGRVDIADINNDDHAYSEGVSTGTLNSWIEFSETIFSGVSSCYLPTTT